MELTISERERLAYISGDTELAAELGKVMDEIEAAVNERYDDAYDSGYEDGRESGYDEGLRDGREERVAHKQEIETLYVAVETLLSPLENADRLWNNAIRAALKIIDRQRPTLR